MKLYATREEAIQHEIVDPIEAGGEIPDAREAFDIAGIAADAIQYEDGYHAETHTLRLNDAGFYCPLQPDVFWALAFGFKR